MTTAVVAVTGLLLSFMTAVPALSAENSSSSQHESAAIVEANSENKSFNFIANIAEDQQIHVLLSEDMVDEGMITFERVGNPSNVVSLRGVTLAGEPLESDSYASVEASDNHSELITVQLDRDSEQTVKDSELVISYSAATVDSPDSWKLNLDVDAFTLATPDKERGVVQPRSASYTVRVEAFPTNPKLNEEVTFTYVIRNTSGNNLWWLDGGDHRDSAHVISDKLCAPIKYGSGWSTTARYTYIKPNSEARLTCSTKFDVAGKKYNEVTLKAGEFWNRNTYLRPFESLNNYRLPFAVEVQDKKIDRGEGGNRYTVVIPTAPVTPKDYESNRDPKWSIQKASSKDYVKPSGELVKYTYTVRNLSGDKLYFRSMKDDSCSPLRIESGIVKESRKRQFIPAGSEAVWTCTSVVQQVTVGIVDATFFNSAGDASSAGAATYVGVRYDNATNGNNFGIARCDVIDYTTVNESSGVGTLGSMDPGKAPEENKDFPADGAPRNPKSPGNLARMTTASATSAQHPEWVYYTPRVGGQAAKLGDPNIGLYRVHKQSGRIEKITDAQWEVEGEGKLRTEKPGATYTNRLAFGPDGTLWSFSGLGKMYSLQLDQDGKATSAGWKDHGFIGSDVKYSGGKQLFLSDLLFGDIAIDGNNTMWIIGSTVGTETLIDGVYQNTKNEDSFLFSLSAARLLANKGDTAHLITNLTKKNSLKKKGFFGLAFGPDGTLYASYDASDKSIYGNRIPDGEMYSINLETGEAKFLFSSPRIKGVQDLSSCAFPKAHISAEKTGVAVDSSHPNQIKFTIKVSNTSKIPAPGIKLLDVLDGNKYEFIKATLNGNEIGKAGENPFKDERLINSPNKHPGVVSPNAPAVVELTVHATGASSSDGAHACNQADVLVSGDVVKTDDPSTANAPDPTCLPLAQKPLLEISKTGGSIVKNGNAGDSAYEAEYEIRVENIGNIKTSYTTIDDALSYVVDDNMYKQGWPDQLNSLKMAWSRSGSDENAQSISIPNNGKVKIGTEKEKWLEPKGVHLYKVKVNFVLMNNNDGVTADFGVAKELCNSAKISNTDFAESRVCNSIPKAEKAKVTIRKASYDPKTQKSAVLPDLGGAEFIVYSAKEGQQESPNFDSKVAEISKEKGLTFDVDASKTYYLVETKAPKGLSLLPEPVKLISKTNAAGKIVVEAVNSLNVEVAGAGDQIVVTVNDVHTGDLPLSGGHGVWIPGLVGLFIMLGGLVLAFRHGHAMNTLAIRR
ncbi:hypothetical protein JTE88_01050 [Arcanobacterium phocisimile]|uniref:Uncharacterized protein n=1 Tax=Arcanobacterium phocisimile TaxID=1302235 RepID=A0ABX7IHT4_9ACTO|nr:hypothetical protein [Arcanobacterium phocisimile]QRV02382.1 hypothetical protein JTE88_01050 [Arcanobacterium phocisimile]